MNLLIAKILRLVAGAIAAVLSYYALPLYRHSRLRDIDTIVLAAALVPVIVALLGVRFASRGDEPRLVIRRIWLDMILLGWSSTVLAAYCFFTMLLISLAEQGGVMVR